MSNALWKIWDDHETVTLPTTQYTIKGFSIAALRTNFVINELKIMLDAGISYNVTPDYIFVSHVHSDHIANMPFHLMTTQNDQRKIQVFVPAKSCTKLWYYVKSLNSLSCDVDIDYSSPNLLTSKYYDIIPVDPNTESVLNLTIKNKNFKVEIIPCDHSVQCIGYGFIEQKVKLADEYVGLSGAELGKLRKQGINFNKIVEAPFFCFLGDTSKEVLSDNRLEKYTTVMIECTFIEEEDLGQADETKHMHWIYLEPYVRTHPDITFILYHFSQRYKKEFINEFFNGLQMQNVIVWAS